MQAPTLETPIRARCGPSSSDPQAVQVHWQNAAAKAVMLPSPLKLYQLQHDAADMMLLIQPPQASMQCAHCTLFHVGLLQPH